MNEWYQGLIENRPVSIFLCDDWQMDYLLTEGETYPPRVLEACERIRAAKMRSLSGCKRVLAENGWTNA